MTCFFMKWLKILIVKVAEFGNTSTKNIDRQRYFIYYVFWSILSQMRHVCCEIFPKNVRSRGVSALFKDTTCGHAQGSNSWPWDHESGALTPGGGLNFGFGRDVLLEIWMWTHFYTKFSQNFDPFLYQKSRFSAKFDTIFRNFQKFLKIF